MRRSSACAVIQAAQAASTAAGTASSPAVPTSRSEQRRGDEEARAGGHPRGGAHGDGEGRGDVEPHMGELGERDAEVVDVPSRCTAAGRGRPGSARGGRPRSRTRRRSRSRSRRRSPGSPPGGAPSPSRRRSRPSSSRPRSGRRRAPRSRRNEPAVARTVCSRWPNAPERATTIPTTEPSAISGASGPSTAPKESVPIAASAIPGACDTGVAPPPMPSSGGRPPSPGSSRRARRTTHAPAGGSRSTRYHGGAVAECAGQAVPQPVLEVVHHREEERGEKRRRDPDHRSERDKPQLRAAAEGLRLGHGRSDASGRRGRPRGRAVWPALAWEAETP